MASQALSENISKSVFLKIVSLVLENSYFTYNGGFYMHVFGISMGPKLSFILAQNVIDTLLEEPIPKLYFNTGTSKS